MPFLSSSPGIEGRWAPNPCLELQRIPSDAFPQTTGKYAMQQREVLKVFCLAPPFIFFCVLYTKGDHKSFHL